MTSTSSSYDNGSATRSEAAIQTDVMVNGLLRPLTIRRDQLNPHAVVEVAGVCPLRSAARWTIAGPNHADRMFPKREFRFDR